MRSPLAVVLSVILAGPCWGKEGKPAPAPKPPVDVGIKWVTIHGGRFVMGSDDGGPDEKPSHEVTVPTFQMAKTLVTYKQYQKCVEAGACAKPSCVAPGGDYPVPCVNWQQARDFSAWVGGRLPTEAEWEYAARSRGKAQKYPWGDEEPTCARAVFKELSVRGCGKDTSAPVCSRPAGNTEQGLCDMAGNMWQWLQDWYHDSYNSVFVGEGQDILRRKVHIETVALGAPVDGSAWEDPPGTYRVVRGGSWFNDAALLRAAHRFGSAMDYRLGHLGFRPARSLP
ncbi:MAG: formylglycine-generating enzyme family protein [Elusimicrobia bacterium]|nr:formylglycine-generating enzyme family protein [Elusimicrobiota bacterium]